MFDANRLEYDSLYIIELMIVIVGWWARRVAVNLANKLRSPFDYCALTISARFIFCLEAGKSRNRLVNDDHLGGAGHVYRRRLNERKDKTIGVRYLDCNRATWFVGGGAEAADSHRANLWFARSTGSPTSSIRDAANGDNQLVCVDTCWGNVFDILLHISDRGSPGYSRGGIARRAASIVRTVRAANGGVARCFT